METRNKEQLRNFGIACKPIANQIKNFVIENWRLLFVNIIGIVGISIALNLFAIFYNMIKTPLPVEYYYFMSAGSFAYGMWIFYKVLKFDGQAAISKIKNERKIRN